MTIHVSCPNGHKLKAKETHAGRTLSCPECGAKVLVPKHNLATDAFPMELSKSDMFEDQLNLPGTKENDFVSFIPLRSQVIHSRPVPESEQPADSQNITWMVGAAIAGSTLALFALLTVWLLFGHGGSQNAISNAGAGLRPKTTESFEKTTSSGYPRVLVEADKSLGLLKSQPEAAASTPTQIPTLDDAGKNERIKQLKDVAIAMLNYQSAFRQFPVINQSSFYGADGKLQVSWRVHLLPFLEQRPLYDQFKLDEPWDSPHNITLIDKMPDVFRDPIDILGSNKTRIVTLIGPGTAFSKPYGPKYQEFIDGAACTLLIVSVGGNNAIPWTKPDDLVFDVDSAVGCLGQLDSEAIFCARTDGAVQVLKSTIPPEIFRAFVSPSGGEQPQNGFMDYLIR